MPDGTGLTRLTFNPAYDRQPAWSPNGSLLAFTSNRTDPNFATCVQTGTCNWDIFVMRANGSGVRQLTFDTGDDEWPEFSPDGMSPDLSMSASSSSRGASATTSPDLRAGGPINVRAELEAIARDPKAGYRERLGALQTLAKMDEAAGRPSSEGFRPGQIGTLAAEPQRRKDGTITYRLWMRERLGWASPIDGLTPRNTVGLLAVCLLQEELGDDFVHELRAGLPADKPDDEEPQPGDDEEPESATEPKSRPLRG